MKKILYSIFLILLSGEISYSQKEENIKLLGQSPDGKTFKLMWFMRTWDASIKGFDLKRKSANGNWEMLNKTPIIPELSVSKDLSNVEPDVNEQSRLKQKLQKLISFSKAHEVKSSEYLKKLSSDANAIGAVALIIGLDFDMALLNGFGLVDRNIPPTAQYEYALFASGTQKVLATTIWKYGEKPDLNILTQINSRSTAKKGNIQILWNTDKEKTDKVMLAGFNIYRNKIKLNENPKMAIDDIVKMQYTFFDSAVNNMEITQYAISAQSIFGIEGAKVFYDYNPMEHPNEYIVPSNITIEPEGENYEKGIRINWTFPNDQEIFIKRFVVEKDNMPVGYVKISDLLSPAARKFIDKTPSPVASYIKFRIITVFKDGTEISSNEILYYYFPNIKPPKPMNPKGELKVENKVTYIKLSWDPKDKSDTITDFYQIYATNPVNGKFFLEAGISPIKENFYNYEIDYSKATKYKFGIASVSKYAVAGPISDTVEVMTPSKELPYMSINSISLDSNRVYISWTYPDIWDIKGFRIFQNGNLVATEYELKKGSNQFHTPGLKWGATYDFAVQAVSEYGVESQRSVPASIIIQPVKRK